MDASSEQQTARIDSMRGLYEPWQDGGDPLRSRLRAFVAPIITGAVSAWSGHMAVVAPTEPIPTDKPVIFIAPHRHWTDIPRVVQVAHHLGFDTPRFPFKSEYLDNQLIGRLFISLGGIPVVRGDPEVQPFLHTIAQRIESGESAAIFGGGTRQRSVMKTTDADGNKVMVPTGIDLAKVEKIRRGASYLAALTGAQVVPVAIAGNGDNDSGRAPYLLGAPLVAVVHSPIAPPEIGSVPEKKQMLVIGSHKRTTAEALQVALDKANAIRTHYMK